MEAHKLPSDHNLISSWTFCGFGVLFLLFDSVSKLIQPEANFLYILSILLFAIPKVFFFGILMLAGWLLSVLLYLFI